MQNEYLQYVQKPIITDNIKSIANQNLGFIWHVQFGFASSSWNKRLVISPKIKRKGKKKG